MKKIVNTILIAMQNEKEFLNELVSTIEERQKLGYDVSVQYSHSINETIVFYSALIICRTEEK